MSLSVCISHKEDVDGISSAALIKTAFRVKSVILVDYSNLISTLEKLTASLGMGQKTDRVFLCDLGLSKRNEQRFIDIVGGIISNGFNVTYVDHHELRSETANALRKTGVTLVHSVDECTSVQIYSKFKKKLKTQAAFFAAAGALTDYMENRPIASSIVAKFDRQFLMLEATALSYMISANQHNNEFLSKIVDSLAGMKYPHEIEGGFSIVEKQAQKISNAIKKIEKSIIKIDNLAYMQSNLDLSANMVVNSVLGISERAVAMVYKLKDDINCYIISIRGSKDCKVHLGRLINDIASEMGGSGGGHDKACGAVIPKEKIQEFIQRLDKGIASIDR
jgi:oligoribonuclease NrnB/cAMP/cGMP phosphodiesterase (DHH superfamily)